MKKRKMTQLIVGLLSAAMLLTGEGMAGIAYAAPLEADTEADPFTPSPAEITPAETAEDVLEDDAISEDAASSDTDILSDDETSDETDSPSDTIPEPETSAETEISTEEESNSSEEESTPEIQEPTEEPDGEPTDPQDTVSGNTVSMNNLFALAETPELTDFELMDEGENIVSGQTIRIKQGTTRQLSLKPMPAEAVIVEDSVEWSCDNERIVVAAGKISLAETPETAPLSGTVTATIKTGELMLTRSCQIEFLPLMTDFEIVVQNEGAVSESGISILPGQQKKLTIKALPEGAVSEVRTSWKIGNSSQSGLRVQNDILSVYRTPSELPHETTLTAIVSAGGTRLEKTCKVTVLAPSEGEGMRLGDIEFFCGAVGNLKKTEGAENTWDADFDQSSKNKYFTLTYKGAPTEEEYRFYYANSSRGMTIRNNRVSGGKVYSRSAALNPKYPFQVLLETGRKGRGTLSAIYTIQFNSYKTDFTITPSTINTVPNGAEQELQVLKLPDGRELKDVSWNSGDERIVKVKEQTEKGVMLQFGQSYGRTQITAVVKDFKGQEHYAVCNVNVSMKLPLPVMDSESGGETSETVTETIDGEQVESENYFWLIDKGGKVTLSLRGLEKAQIYYTTNGSDPTTSGKLYQGPITINAKTTIKAYAKLNGYGDSDVTESEFRIGNPKLTISPASVSIAQDSSKTLTVSFPSGCDVSGLTWESSDSEIASAGTTDITNADGDVIRSQHEVQSFDKAGVCTITASINDYAGRTQTASCRVTVTGKLEITPEITMFEEEQAEIKITKMPGGIPRDEVMWKISDSALISGSSMDNGNLQISSKQLANAVGPQTVTVTASVYIGDDLVYACCQVTVNPKQYTVRFLGLHDKPAKTESVYRGQNATPPDTAVMESAAPKGYRFTGWKEPETTWKGISADTDIHAVYTLETFTITYKNLIGTDGVVLGTNPGTNPAAYTVETRQSELVLYDAVPAADSGKRFVGWYLEEDYSGSPLEEIPMGSAEDILLYAKWAAARTGLRIEAIADQPYTGKAVKPEIQVYDGDTLLTLGTDYTVSYKNNTKASLKPWTEAALKKAPTVTVKGKGNYEKSDTETFQIVPQSIASGADGIDIPDLYLAYNNGRKLSVVPVVTWNGKKLKNNIDFNVTSIVKQGDSKNLLTEGCSDEGIYTVTISGKGNFTDARDIALTVTTKTLLGKVSFKGKMKDMVWSGKTLEESGFQPDDGVMLKKGGDELKKGTDYTVSFNAAAKEVGTYTAVFTGIGENYAGTVQKTFQITGMPLKANNLDFGQNWKKTMPYNGTSQTQDISLSYKKDRNTQISMTPGTDYTLTYENATNVGKKAAVIITGKGAYTGTVKKTFQITPYSLKDSSAAEMITTALADSRNNAVPYEKGGAKPKVIVKYGDTLLTEGTDYTVSYKNNNKTASKDETKAPSYTIKGKGNFKDALMAQTFSVTPQDISQLTITAEDVMAAAPNAKKNETIGMTAAGKYKSTPKITDVNGKTLSAGADFEKTYTFTDENGVVLGAKDRVPENSVLTVTVKGCKNYTGETKVSYRVLAAKMSLKSASVSLKKGIKKYYDLEPVTLKKEELVVKLNGKELDPDNYTIVSYENNRKKGTAKVTIKGVGEYGGSKTVNFAIKSRILMWVTSHL
ncbi:MAG: chitobiase/beta-hexosaminidase C-terminal domain-containing protein [Clostridium sp.]|nr:chitobiase/beta-hexosaminidase C-terminal domain-containing protein [Clostridium sp.]